MIPSPWLGFLRGVFLANHLASNDNLTRTTKRWNMYKCKTNATQKGALMNINTLKKPMLRESLVAFYYIQPGNGRSGLAVACPTAVREVLGSNHAAGSCVYCKNHCDLQPWARTVCTLPAVARSTQPSTLRGTLNEYQLSGWVIIINGDGGCRR